MIESIQNAWIFVSSGTVISWIVTSVCVLGLFVLIYFRRFFINLAVFLLVITGGYFLITTFDFSWIGDLLNFVWQHIERVIEEGKKQ